LHLGIHPDHLGVQLRVVAPHNLGIPARCDKDSLDAARQGRREDVGDLEADEEGKGNNDGRVRSVAIVGRVGKEEVEIGEEGASITDEESTEREDRANETFLANIRIWGLSRQHLNLR
jgi:hypothetical protein